MLRDAFIALNGRLYPGSRTDAVPGGVGIGGSNRTRSIRRLTSTAARSSCRGTGRSSTGSRNCYGKLTRGSPSTTGTGLKTREIPNANSGGGLTGTLNLLTPDFMGYGGEMPAPIGEPWLSAGYYRPGATPDRDTSDNPADPPRMVTRYVAGSPATAEQDRAIVAAPDYRAMRQLLEPVHDSMHGFVAMGSQHISFRDPFVFLLHSNVDRLFALWQMQLGKQERLDPNLVYGPEDDPRLNRDVEPWSTGHAFDMFGDEHFTRPWYAPRARVSRKRTSIPRLLHRLSTTSFRDSSCRPAPRCTRPTSTFEFGDHRLERRRPPGPGRHQEERHRHGQHGGPRALRGVGFQQSSCRRGPRCTRRMGRSTSRSPTGTATAARTWSPSRRATPAPDSTEVHVLLRGVELPERSSCRRDRAARDR